MPKVTFYPAGKSVDVPRDMSLLDAAEKLGVTLHHDCGGFATCSTCRILIVEGTTHLSEIDLDEENMLEEAELSAPFRLSCQAKIQGDVVARIPDGQMKWSKEALQVLEDHTLETREIVRIIVEARARKRGVDIVDYSTAKLLLDHAETQMDRVEENPVGLAALIKQAYGES